MEAARSHNTARDRKTRERLFEGASFLLDTGQLLAVKHFPFPVTGPSGFVTAPSCYLSLGQNVAITSSSLSCSCHRGSDSLKNPMNGFCRIGSTVFETANCFEYRIFQHLSPSL